MTYTKHTVLLLPDDVDLLKAWLNAPVRPKTLVLVDRLEFQSVEHGRIFVSTVPQPYTPKDKKQYETENPA